VDKYVAALRAAVCLRKVLRCAIKFDLFP